MDSAQLVRELLTFAREADHDKQHIPLLPTLKEAIKTAQIGISESVTVSLDLEERTGIIYGDAIHLKQAIINIINNARDAISESSEKTIAIRMRSLQRSACQFASHCSRSCDYICQIKISDTGIGVNQADIEKIFDPFFTTKPNGKGTGLGLSTAVGTIRDHGGAINVESIYGKGSTFIICLPMNDKDDKVQTEGEEIKVIHSSGDIENHTILVVDDDDAVRGTTVEIIHALGYHTISAVNGEDAYYLYEQHPGQVDLILTDIVMPKMDGIELVLKIRQKNSQIPAILMTGYDSTTHHSQRITGDEQTCLLNKPIRTQSLGSVIADLLAETKR